MTQPGEEQVTLHVERTCCSPFPLTQIPLGILISSEHTALTLLLAQLMFPMAGCGAIWLIYRLSQEGSSDSFLLARCPLWGRRARGVQGPAKWLKISKTSKAWEEPETIKQKMINIQPKVRQVKISKKSLWAELGADSQRPMATFHGCTMFQEAMISFGSVVISTVIDSKRWKVNERGKDEPTERAFCSSPGPST